MSFSGFSEDDIRKIAKGHDVNKQKGHQKTSLKKVSFKANHNVSTSSRSKSLHNTNTARNNTAQEISENAKLSIQDKPNDVADDIKKTQPNQPAIEEKSDKLITESDETKSEPVKDEKKFRDLDEFEARQKLIEEQNRKRKELLAKALADRTKRTQEEAQKLNEIQQEFQKLDAMLSCDVKILRKQIELASIEYMECQKKYHKVEKEFLEAKCLLHQKQERKEMLTEHLCAIIEKNEERKAEKLNELLQRLQLSPAEANQNEENVTVQSNTNKENDVGNP
ncbi:hypothetical protein Zmor_005614 [Zophobas morio]|uniref:RAB6-interacting golgin n=1 Tax=Zophobas morio TaxID=2755281 RepID=A0AA38MM19_9CUCU|nr:hypothetical protein Zmor_005614 [Zophobas morio]